MKRRTLIAIVFELIVLAGCSDPVQTRLEQMRIDKEAAVLLIRETADEAKAKAEREAAEQHRYSVLAERKRRAEYKQWLADAPKRAAAKKAREAEIAAAEAQERAADEINRAAVNAYLETGDETYLPDDIRADADALRLLHKLRHDKAM